MKDQIKQQRTKVLSSGGLSKDGKLNFSVEKEIEFLKYENKNLLKQVNCSSCGDQIKEYMLPCGHLFCKDCVDKEISTRRRMCPLDRKKFT